MIKRILIAEDDATTREVLIKYAKLRGYDVVSVTNGVDLLTIATDEKFDLIITDLMMPDLNGASATEIMKLQGSTTPVIALTGLSLMDIGLVQDKFTKVYHKPIDINYLFKYVDSLLGT
jgi:CheY-like chemotaxis protein